MEDVEHLTQQESIAKLIAKEVKKVLGNQKKHNHGIPKNETTARSTTKPNGNNKAGNNHNQEKGNEKLNEKPREVKPTPKQNKPNMPKNEKGNEGWKSKLKYTPSNAQPSSSKGTPNALRFGSRKTTKPRNYQNGPLQNRIRPQKQCDGINR